MKKLILFSLLSVISIFSVFYLRSLGNNKTKAVLEKKETLGAQVDRVALRKIDFDNKVYLYVIYKIDNIDKLILVPNFREKYYISEIQSAYQCSFIVSGGFYDTESNPLGLFIYDYKKISGYLKIDILNAVLSINDFGTPRITRDMPGDNLRIAVQSGPILVENGSVVKFNGINNDLARRIIAVVDGDNQLYFIALFLENNYYAGPTLSDLGSILSQVFNVEAINIADAVNLDGGSASFFVQKNFKLSELVNVGSYFCLKP